MEVIKRGLNLYVQHFDKLLIFSFLVLLPFLLLHTFFVNYIYALSTFGDITLIGDFTNAFMMLLILGIVQIPYIKYVLLEEEGEEAIFRRSFATYMEKAAIVFVFSGAFAVAVVVGSILFFIPGLILLVFFYLTPHNMVKNNIGIVKAMKRATTMAKKNFFTLLGLILFVGVLDWLIGFGVIQLTLLFTDSYLGVLMAETLISLIVFPLGVVIITLKFNDWHEDYYQTN